MAGVRSAGAGRPELCHQGPGLPGGCAVPSGLRCSALLSPPHLTAGQGDGEAPGGFSPKAPQVRLSPRALPCQGLQPSRGVLAASSP